MKEDNILVAVYGSLRKGLGNHRLLKQAKYVGTYETLPIFNMYSIGAFPGVTENGFTSITMEVYKIDSKILKKLDDLEGYHNNDMDHYKRRITDTPFGEAYMYIYNRTPKGLIKVTGGDWKEFYTLNQIKNYS